MGRIRAAVGVVNPFGAIFTKELRVTSRRRRSYVLRVAYLGALLLALLATFSSTRHAFGGVAARVQEQALMGALFFFCFSLFCVIAMGLIAPVLTATAINSERLHNTLHVLLMTPISNTQIVSGKLFSRLLVALTLIGLSLPVLALVRLLGGVELHQMLGVICLCVSFAMGCAAIGLFYSAILSRAYAVILLSYGTLLLIYWFVPMCFAIATRPGPRWIEFFCAINPVMCTGILAAPQRVMPVMVEWWPAVVVQLGLTAMLVLFTSLLLRRIARREGGDAQPALQAATVPAMRPPPLPKVVFAGPAGPTPQGNLTPLANARPSVVSDNPILWREIRRPLIQKRWHKVVAAMSVITVLLVSYLVLGFDNSLGEKGPQFGYANVFCGLIWLLTAVLAATAIAQEKESDTWTLLLAAPLRGRAIVWGKVLGLLRRMLWPTVLVMVHFILFALFGVIRWPAVVLIIWVIISFNSLWIATGLYLSLRLHKVTTAVIINLMLAVIAYPAAFFLVLTVVNLMDAPDRIAELVGWSIPYVYISFGLEAIQQQSPREIYFLNYGHLTIGEFYAITFAAGLAYIGFAAAILGHTARHFDLIVGRATHGPFVPPPIPATGARIAKTLSVD